MGFLLSKLLPLLAYPLGLSLVLLAAPMGRRPPRGLVAGQQWSALLWSSAMPLTGPAGWSGGWRSQRPPHPGGWCPGPMPRQSWAAAAAQLPARACRGGKQAR